MCNMHRKTPVLESLFNKVVGLKTSNCNFTKKRLQNSCFPVKTEKFLRTAFFLEHISWPPLNNVVQYSTRNTLQSRKFRRRFYIPHIYQFYQVHIIV